MKYNIIVINIKNSSKQEKELLNDFFISNDYENTINNSFYEEYVLIIKDELGKVKIHQTNLENLKYLKDSNNYNINMVQNINHFFRYIKIKKIKNKNK